MKLIVGLGNPGKRYAKNRHNAGYMLVDKLCFSLAEDVWKKENKFQANLCKITKYNILLVKPTTFMNESGSSVSKIISFYKITADDVYVVHDDLDLKLGEYKTQKGIGPQLHYGVQSVEKNLSTADFWRIRIGVDNRTPSARTLGEKYVLSDFQKEELMVLNDVFIKVIEDLMDKIFK